MPKILVIDDEKSIRRSLREILEFEKFTVDEAEDGLSGLTKITSEQYDVVLCDIKMPKLDGLELLQKLSAENNEVPLVMMSGHGNIETAVEAVKKGAYDFLTKPIDLNRLLVTLRGNIREFRNVMERLTILCDKTISDADVKKYTSFN